MAVLPKVDVVFVGFGLVGGVIANELGKRTTLRMVALERGPFRRTIPELAVDHAEIGIRRRLRSRVAAADRCRRAGATREDRVSGQVEDRARRFE